MRKFVTLVLLVTSCSVAYATNTLEIERNISAECTKFKLCLDRTVSHRIGLAAYGEVTKGWAQAYAGPSLKLSNNLNGWIGLGTQNSGEIRFGGAVWVGKNKLSLLYLYSGGGSAGPWHESYFAYRVSRKVAAGFVENSGKGMGGRLDYNVNAITQLRTTFLEKDGRRTTCVNLRLFF